MEFLQRVETMQYLAKNRLHTKMIRIDLFSIFTIKIPRGLAAPLGTEDTDKCTLNYSVNAKLSYTFMLLCLCTNQMKEYLRATQSEACLSPSSTSHHIPIPQVEVKVQTRI